jgi:hypothetical protein
MDAWSSFAGLFISGCRQSDGGSQDADVALQTDAASIDARTLRQCDDVRSDTSTKQRLLESIQ